MCGGGQGGWGGYSPNQNAVVAVVVVGDTNHNDRDRLPTVAHSIQYSWKCDTFLFAMDGAHSKTRSIHKHWLFVWEHN